MRASKSSLSILLLSLASSIPQGRKICFTCNLSSQQCPNHFICQWNVIISSARKLAMSVNMTCTCCYTFASSTGSSSFEKCITQAAFSFFRPWIEMGNGKSQVRRQNILLPLLYSFPAIETPASGWICFSMGPVKPPIDNEEFAFSPALEGPPATDRTFPMCQLFQQGHVAYHERITERDEHNLSLRLPLLLLLLLRVCGNTKLDNK